MPETQQTDFDPAQTSALYDELLPSWELNRDFGEMHLSTLTDGTYLDQFGTSAGDKASEPQAQYAKRKLWSFAIDHCQDLIGLRVDNLFRTPPKRTYEDSPYREAIERFLADVDGGGTSMDSFMRRALVMHYVNGVDIVVDKQTSDVLPANAAQESEMGLRAYIHAFSPIDRVDWATDHAGRYLWARYCLGAVLPDDETADDPEVTRFLTMTPAEWRLYTVPGEGDITVTSAPHALGVCPVVPFYFKESTRAEYRKVPLSLLTRISPIARYLLNLVSQIQLDIYRNIGFLVATGVQPENVPTEITPMGCWALPEGATLSDVAGSVEHIREKREFAETLIQAILRIGKLAGHSGELQSRATSGVQVAVERTDLDNEMQMTAAQAEAVETEVVRLAVSRNIGAPIEPDALGYAVEYNKKYVLASAKDIVANIKALVETDTHSQVPATLRVLLRHLLGALTSESDDQYQEGIEQIEAMDAGSILATANETPFE